MEQYIVTLKELPDDTETFVFLCHADDDEHAFEQAENAYPDCIILCVNPVL